MRAKMILPATLLVTLATASGAIAQQMPNDRTGDHMFSYGAAPINPTRTHAQPARHYAPQTLHTPIDRTSEHMLYYGPVAQ